MDASAAPLALRVCDLFNARAAEATYQRLVDTLNHQARETQLLRAQVSELEATQRASEAQAAVATETRLAALLSRLERLEARAQTLDEHCKRSDEHAARHEIALRDAALEQRAVRSEVMRVEAATTKALYQVRSEAASFDLVNSLQVDQRLLHDRLSTIDRRLDAKMEKSEASRMDALIAKINAFAPKSEAFEAHLAALDASHTALKQALDVRDQSEKLELVDDALRRLATKASSVETSQRVLSAKFQSAAAALAEQLQQQGETFEALLRERARSADVLKQFADVDRALQTCALADDVHTLEASVQRLTEQCSTLDKHVRVSARFLDWFAERGEAYEHNLEVVETQLQRIATHSQPAHREPFGDQVRYPRRM